MDLSKAKELSINGQPVVMLQVGDVILWKKGGEPTVLYDYALIDTPDNKEDGIPYQYSRSNSKWYRLNNLNQLEPYGVYEEVSDITAATHYDGKLINVNGDEYQYLNGQWNLVGKIENTMSLVYTFGPGEEWDRERPFPMHFQIKKEQLDQEGMFDPNIMAMEAEIRLRYGGMNEFSVMDFNTGNSYDGEITNDDTWVYFNNPCPNDIMVDRVRYWGMAQLEMYSGSFHADVEYASIDIVAKEGEYGSDCSFITEPYIKNKIYNIGGYFMTHNEDGCSRVEGVNPYGDKTSYFVKDDTITEFQLLEPEVKQLPYYFFVSCNNLSTINLPYVEKGYPYFIQNCSNCKNVYAPNASLLQSYFLDNQKMNDIDFTNLQEINYMVIHTNLWKGGKVMSLPECSKIKTAGIYITDMEELHLPKCRLIETNGINPMMSNLKSLTLPSDVVLMGSQFFPSSMITSLDDRNFAWKYGSSYFSDKSVVNVNLHGIMPYTWYNNSVVTSIYLPITWCMGYDGVHSCPNLQYFNAPKLESLEHAFYKCGNLREVIAPMVSFISGVYFSSCSQLTTVNLTNAQTIQGQVFSECSALRSVTLTNCHSVGYRAFYKCTSLTSLSLPNVEYINHQAFDGCLNLTSLWLMGSKKCEIDGPFQSTGITSSTGSIIVPKSLWASYMEDPYLAWCKRRIFSY